MTTSARVSWRFEDGGRAPMFLGKLKILDHEDDDRTSFPIEVGYILPTSDGRLFDATVGRTAITCGFELH